MELNLANEGDLVKIHIIVLSASASDIPEEENVMVKCGATYPQEVAYNEWSGPCEVCGKLFLFNNT